MNRNCATVIAGYVAASLELFMWFTVIDQIKLNIEGQKGSFILACAITLNCIAWVSYGSLKSPRDWPMIVSNAPGIILGGIAAFTTLIF